MGVFVKKAAFIIFVFIIVIKNGYSHEISKRKSEDAEVNMDVIEVIKYHGYPVEKHEVITADGYILEMQRIPHGKNNTDKSCEGKPVLIMHGLFASSAIWIMNTPDKNLAYIVADKGCDVWLGNFRGNDFGDRHTSLSPLSSKFWDFGMDEMGKYDLPAMIDYILHNTTTTKLVYIGHSMGTTALFALLSTKIEYNEKIQIFNAMAPVARLEHASSPYIRYLIKNSEVFSLSLRLFGSYQFLPDSALYEILSKYLCVHISDDPCSNILFLLLGYDFQQFNKTRLPVYLHFIPAGSSAQAVTHYGQIGHERQFQKYDYGKTKNQELYNQTTPPLYNVSKITAPVALYWSENDWCADPDDVSYLIKNLQNISLNYKVPFEKFNHGDYFWALDVISLLYNTLLENI